MEFVEPLLCLPGNSSDFSFHASVQMGPKSWPRKISAPWNGCQDVSRSVTKPFNPCNILQPCKPSFMNLFWASWRPISSSWLRFSKKIWSTSARCCSFCDLQGRELDSIIVPLGPESTIILRCWEAQSYTIEGYILSVQHDHQKTAVAKLHLSGPNFMIVYMWCTSSGLVSVPEWTKNHSLNLKC